MKFADEQGIANAGQYQPSAVLEEELDMAAFCRRMEERFHKVWCVNHGEDYEKSLKKQTFHKEDYVRS